MKKIEKKNLWVYLFPALMDLSVAAVLIFSAIKAVDLGIKPFLVGVLGSVWGITYFISSLILSRFITRKNSSIFMMISCVSFILLGLFLGFFKSFNSLFVFLFIGGLFSAFFFVGFQLFMEDSTGTSASRASALYTLSWSTGMAFGSISEGFLMGKGLLYAEIPILLPSLVIICGILAFNKLNREKTENYQQVYDNNPNDAVIEQYTRIGWIEIFTVTLVTGGIRYLLPKMTISFFHFNQALAASCVFVFFVFQAISGYISSFFGFLRYKIISHDLLKLLAVLGLLVPVFYPVPSSVFLFSMILGIYSGHAFYSAVLYAINHRKKAGFNVSINESLVGIASVAGPFIAGFMLNSGLVPFFIFPCFVFIAASWIQHGVLNNFPVRN